MTNKKSLLNTNRHVNKTNEQKGNGTKTEGRWGGALCWNFIGFPRSDAATCCVVISRPGRGAAGSRIEMIQAQLHVTSASCKASFGKHSHLSMPLLICDPADIGQSLHVWVLYGCVTMIVGALLKGTSVVNGNLFACVRLYPPITGRW